MATVLNFGNGYRLKWSGLAIDLQETVIPKKGKHAGHDQWRQRLWILAYPLSRKRSLGRESRGGRWLPEQIQGHGMGKEKAAPRVVGSFDGIPAGLDRIRALGNAVVPQIPEMIGRAIMEVEQQREAA